MRRMVLMRLCPQVMESAPAAVEEPLQMVNNRPFDRPPLLLAQSSHLICLLWLLVMPNFDSFTSGDVAQWWDGGSGVRGAGWGNATGCEAHLLIDGIILMAKSPSYGTSWDWCGPLWWGICEWLCWQRWRWWCCRTSRGCSTWWQGTVLTSFNSIMESLLLLPLSHNSMCRWFDISYLKYNMYNTYHYRYTEYKVSGIRYTVQLQSSICIWVATSAQSTIGWLQYQVQKKGMMKAGLRKQHQRWWAMVTRAAWFGLWESKIDDLEAPLSRWAFNIIHICHFEAWKLYDNKYA